MGSIMPKGVLAFDIDGTLVQKNRPFSTPLIDLMHCLSAEGWIFFFATGRTLKWSKELLSVLKFPYFIAPYNGACTIRCPEDTIIRSSFLDWFDVLKLSSYVQQFGAMLYEAGGEERIFYTPMSFSKPFLDHLHKRQTIQKELWIPLESLEKLPSVPIASVRFFLSPAAATILSETIIRNTNYHAPTMKDSFDSRVHIVQVTASGASKGTAIKAIRSWYPGLPAIAAGDDVNDIDLLQAADVGIAMPDAPEELKKIAHIVASE
jgi:HAD superfamily hydrolase (TIGR01484 family)